MIELVIDPAGKAGLFSGRVGNEIVVRSRQPFLDGARVLLARGYDPATPYNMRHARSQVQAFVTTTIGHAAELRAADDGSGMRFRRFVPYEELPAAGISRR
jgi:hypothetical protein